MRLADGKGIETRDTLRDGWVGADCDGLWRDQYIGRNAKAWAR